VALLRGDDRIAASLLKPWLRSRGTMRRRGGPAPLADAPHSTMHHASMRKAHTPYSFFDVAEFLQTRMHNARDERAAGRDAKSSYSIGFLATGDGRRDRAEGVSLLPLTLCPLRCSSGKELSNSKRPPPLC
jgi:hypothetical protein